LAGSYEYVNEASASIKCEGNSKDSVDLLNQDSAP